MKLHKILKVDGKPYELIEDSIRLDLQRPGRADFTLRSAAPVRGLVTFDIGYNDRAVHRHFIGYVEHCVQTHSQTQAVVCRELSHGLASPLPMALRHVDLREVASQISLLTGLRFHIPDAGYTHTKAPFFYSLGNGFMAMDSLAEVFQIPDFIWVQGVDGDIYLGSWADSHWGNIGSLSLPTELFDVHYGHQSAQIVALPGLRPGVLINRNARISALTLTDTHMALEWITQ